MANNGLRKLNVLLIIEADIATTQLVEQILSYLKESGLGYRKRLLVELKVSDFMSGELPLVIRSCDPSLRYWLQVWRSAGIPFVFYLDDNFWQIEGDTELARYYKHPLVRRTLDLVVARADRVLANSNILAGFLEGLNKSVKILPATFSFELIDGMHRYTGGELRIGFAGSPSRVKDLEIIAPILSPLLQRYPNVVIEFVGVFPRGVTPSSRIRFFPHVANYEDYIHFQVRRGWVIGWAPLFDTIANRSKTNNKYREYAACSIAGIYTNIPPYRGSVQPGETGLLVINQPEAWLSATEELLNNATLRKAIVHAAYLDVYERHSLPAVAGGWLQVLQDSHNRVPVLSRRLPRLRFTAVYWLQQVWLQIDISYQEGGMRLVFKRAAARIARTLSAFKIF